MNRTLIGLLQASRIPNLFVIALAQLMGAWLLIRNGQVQDFDLPLALLMVSTMMVAGAGYIINDYFDLKIDLINRPDDVVVGRELSRRNALLFHTLISVAAVGVGWFAHPRVALMHFVSVTLLWLFSGYLKRFYLGKMLIAALAAGTVMAVAWMYWVFSFKLLAFAVFGGAIIWVRELVKDMENIKGAHEFGIESVPEVWGIRATKRLIATIGTVGLVLLAWFIYRVQDNLMFWYYVGLAPFLVWFAIRLFQADQREHFTFLRWFTNFLVLAGLVSMAFV
jgi:4-hydroxybenzoate polyprenyltransferase